MVDYRTPFWNKAPRHVIVDNLLSILDAPQDPIANQDRNEAPGVGPMSLMLPWSQRQEDADRYFDNHVEVDNEHTSYAFEKVASLLYKDSIRPLSIDNSVERLKKNTQWGLPYMLQGTQSWELHLELAKKFNSVEDSYASIPYWRGQAKGEETKNRLVWGVPHSVAILEGMLMYPILEALRLVKGFSAWGDLTDVDGAISRMIVLPGLKYSSDYSKFDTSPSAQLGHYIWDCFRHWLIPAVSDLCDLLEEVFFESDLIVPFHVMTGRRGSVPSGSVFTNLFDSLMNLFLGYYIASRLGVDLVDYEVMGDDSVFYYSDEPSAEEISEAVSECGFVMNPDKQLISTDQIHYLQRLHCLDYQVSGVYVGVRSPIRALSGMTGYEYLRKNWSENRESGRAMMQVQDCVNHPSFYSFVEYYYNGDKLVRSGKDPMAIVRDAGGPDQILEDRGRGAFPFVTSDPKGFEDFEVVRIIRELQAG
jgi:hypothetical protein